MSEIREKQAKVISDYIKRAIPSDELMDAIKKNIVNPKEECVLKNPKQCSDVFLNGIMNDLGLDVFSDEDNANFDAAYRLARENNFWFTKTHITPNIPNEEGYVNIDHNKKNMKNISVTDKIDREVEDLLTEKEVIGNELKKLSLADAEIAKIKEASDLLVINGVDDQEGYKNVEEQLKFVTKKRTSLEKKRKEVKDFYVKTGKAIDTEANRLKAKLVEIENGLKAKKKVIDDIYEKLRLEKENADRERLNNRMIELAKYNYAVDVTRLGEISEEDFQVELQYAKDEYQKELDRKKELDLAQKKLDEEKAAFEKEKAEFGASKKSNGTFHTGESTNRDLINKILSDNFDIHPVIKSALDKEHATPVKEVEDPVIYSKEDPFDLAEPALEKPQLGDLANIRNIDFSSLAGLCKEYIDFIDNDKVFTHNNDYEKRISDHCLSLIFGKPVIEFIKKRRP